MEQLTNEQRKETYLKLAQSFEERKQLCGLCLAFGNEFPDLDAYTTPYLLLLFPELALVWATDVQPCHKDEIDFTAKNEFGVNWYRDFPERDEEGWDIRATLLYFAAAMC